MLRLTPPAHAGAGNDDAAAAAFRARGMGVEDLCGECGGELSLRALDRFMSLAAGTGLDGGGPLAIQCGGAGEDLGRAGTLIAAWMLRGGRFAASAEALAWLRIAVPGPAIALQQALLRGAARAAAAERGGPRRIAPPRSISFHDEATAAAARPPPARCVSLCEDEMDALRVEPAEPAGGGGGGAAAPVRRTLLRTQSSFAAPTVRCRPARPAPALAPADGQVTFCIE